MASIPSLDHPGADHVGSVGELLRSWRARRRFSQLDLACEAEVSTRHLSFVETGRARPSREMLIRLAERLDMPLRERNRLLLAGGYAPVHPERALSSAEMSAARLAVEAVLSSHDPFPALVVDRRWRLVAANAGAARLMAGAAPHLLARPANVLRLSLDPQGLAPRILNLPEWRRHLLGRLRAEADRAGDEELAALHDDLAALPCPVARTPPGPPSPVAVPLVIADPGTGEALRFLSTTTVFGTATDVTLAELTLESFFPADDATRAALLNGTAGEGRS